MVSSIKRELKEIYQDTKETCRAEIQLFPFNIDIVMEIFQYLVVLLIIAIDITCRAEIQRT